MTCAHTDPLLTTIKVRTPGVTDDMINLELFNTVNEFCRRTNAWRFETSVLLAQDTQEYPLPLPPDTALVRAIGVNHNDFPVAPVQAGTGAPSQGRALTAWPAELYAEPQASSVFRYAIVIPTTLVISAPPSVEAQEQPLFVVAAITLAQSALQSDCGDWSVPEWMWDMYFEDWLDGCLSRLLSMPAKPWANLPLAQYHGKRFRSALAFRRQEARRGFAYDVPAWRFPIGGFVLR